MNDARIATFISVFSLIISFVTLYFQFIYEDYSLKVSVFGFHSGNDDTGSIVAVFQNNGNKTYTLLPTRLIVQSSSPDVTEQLYAYAPKNLKANTIILNAGQQFATEYITAYDIAQKAEGFLRRHKRLNLVLEVPYVNPKGDLSTDYHKVGTVEYDKNGNAEYTFLTSTFSLRDSVIVAKTTTTVITRTDTIVVEVKR